MEVDANSPSLSYQYEKGDTVWISSGETDSTWNPSMINNIQESTLSKGTFAIEVVKDNGDVQVINTKYDEEQAEFELVKRRDILLGKLHGPDLRSLFIVNEPEIVECLRKSLLEGNSTLSIGPMTLVMKTPEYLVNTSEYLRNEDDVYNDSVLNLANIAIDICKSFKYQPGDTKYNQPIIMLGESNSGKTFNTITLYTHFLNAIRELRMLPPERSLDFVDSPFIQNVEFIFNSFGQASTGRNSETSCFARSIKFAFNTSGLLDKFMFRSFHLEMGRVFKQPAGECNFYSFYDVFQALCPREQITSYRYTKVAPPIGSAEDSFNKYDHLLDAMQSVGFVEENLTRCFEILTGILHLGEVIFIETTKGDSTIDFSKDPVVSKHLQAACDALLIKPAALLYAVSKRCVMIANNTIEKTLNIPDTHASRDIFSSHLYSSIFRWILNTINKTIEDSMAAKFEANSPKVRTLMKAESYSEEKAISNEIRNSRHVVDILDFPGFTSFAGPAGLEQLTVNYCHERFLQYLNFSVFIVDKEILSPTMPMLNFADNSSTVDLIDSRVNGIFTICDDQSKMKSVSSDDKMTQSLHSNHGSGKNKSLIITRTDEFTIKHYMGNVRYKAIGFVETNRIDPSVELVDCLSKSTCEFVKLLATYLEPMVVKPSTESRRGAFRSQESVSNFSIVPDGDANADQPPVEVVSKRPGLRGQESFRSSSNVSVSGEVSPASRRGGFRSQESFRSSSNVSVSGEVSPASRRGGFRSQESFRSTSNVSNSEGISPTSRRGGLKGQESFRSTSNVGSKVASSVPKMSYQSKSKGATLCSQFVNTLSEVLTENRLSQPKFILNLKINDGPISNKVFSQGTILRQLRPYDFVNIVKFYHTTVPYRMTYSSFVKRYAPIVSLLYKEKMSVSNEFLDQLGLCRRKERDMFSDSLADWKTAATLLLEIALEAYAFVLPVDVPANLVPYTSNVKGKLVQKFDLSMCELMHMQCTENQIYLQVPGYFYLETLLARARSQLTRRIKRFIIFYQRGENHMLEKIIECAIRIQKLWKRKKARKWWYRTVLALQYGRQRRLKKKQKAAAIVLQTFFRKKLKHIRAARERAKKRNPPTPVSTPVAPVTPSTLTGPLNDSTYTQSTPNSPMNENNKIFFKSTSVVEETSFDVNQVVIKRKEVNEEEVNSLQPRQRQQLKSNQSSPPPSQRDSTDRKSVSDGYGGSNPNPLAPNTHSRANHMKIKELQAEIEKLRQENDQLKSKMTIYFPTKASSDSFQSKSSEESKKSETSQHYQIIGHTGFKQTEINQDSNYGGTSRSPYFIQLNQPRTAQREIHLERTLNALHGQLSYLQKPTEFFVFSRAGKVRKSEIFLSTDFQFLIVKKKNRFKSTGSYKVDLNEVWRLVAGQVTPAFELYRGLLYGPLPASQSFSLIYGFRSLDLCAKTPDIYEEWFTGIRYLLQLLNGEINEAGVDRQYLKKKFNSFDVMNYGFITRKDVLNLIVSLEIPFDKASFHHALTNSIIKDADTDEISFPQVCSLIYELRKRPEVEIIWSKVVSKCDFSRDIQPLQYSNGKDDPSFLQEVISVSTFQLFWKLAQGQELSEVEAKKIIQLGMGELYDENFPVLSYVGFQKILTNKRNDGYDPARVDYSVRDLGYSLDHYYIATSEGRDDCTNIPLSRKNTSSDQVEDLNALPPTVVSSANAYVQAVERGCRALEMRCFEHFRSSTNNDDSTELFIGRDIIGRDDRLVFKDTISKIADICFEKVSLPLILMLELNCGLQHQKRAAKHLKRVFGSAIFTPAEKGEKIPTPLELKNKVIIFLIHRKRDINIAYKLKTPLVPGFDKDVIEYEGPLGVGKQPGEPGGARMSRNVSKQMSVVSIYDDEVMGSLNARAQIAKKESIDFDFDDIGFNQETSTKRHSSVIERRQSSVSETIYGSLTKANNLHYLWNEIAFYTPDFNIPSYCLQDLLYELSEDPNFEQNLVKKRGLKHCFVDKASKADNSLGGVVAAWDSGIQCVGVSLESANLAAIIHHGKFRANGDCGFVLMPTRLRSSNHKLKYFSSVLTIHLISAVNIPLYCHKSDHNRATESNPSISRTSSRIEDIYTNASRQSVSEKSNKTKDKGSKVLLDLNGTPSDDIQRETETVKKHGKNPIWNEVFSFTVKDCNIGQITFRVFSGSQCTCFVSIPLNNLRTGYRSCTLFHVDTDDHNKIKPLPGSSLFIRVKFDTVDSFNAIHVPLIKKIHESNPEKYQETSLNYNDDTTVSEVVSQRSSVKSITSVKSSDNRISMKIKTSNGNWVDESKHGRDGPTSRYNKGNNPLEDGKRSRSNSIGNNSMNGSIIQRRQSRGGGGAAGKSSLNLVELRTTDPERTRSSSPPPGNSSPPVNQSVPRTKSWLSSKTDSGGSETKKLNGKADPHALSSEDLKRLMHIAHGKTFKEEDIQLMQKARSVSMESTEAEELPEVIDPFDLSVENLKNWMVPESI